MKKHSFMESTIIATVSLVLVKILGMIYVIPFCAIVGTEGSILYAYAWNSHSICFDILHAQFNFFAQRGISVTIFQILFHHRQY